MKSKLILSIACATGLALSSCNSGEPQKTTTPTPAEQPAATQNDALPANDMSAMEAALAQDSTNIQLRTQVAANYYNAGDLNKAAYHFSIVRMIDPKNLDALKNLGNINYDAHKDEAAIHFYEEALKIQPDDINMRCDLATCYSRINKMKKATDILKENIKKDFNHAQSHYNLSVIYEQDGKMKEAAEEMKIYQKISGGKK